MKAKFYASCIALAFFLVCHPLLAQNTAFTYHGHLNSAGTPVSGNYDFTFALFNDPQTGSEIGTTLTNSAVTVSNGLFTTTLDFGGAPSPSKSLLSRNRMQRILSPV